MEAESDQELGRRIRLARLAQDLSQTALAHAVPCTQAAVSRLESGDFTAVSAETRLRVCQILNLGPSGSPIAAKPALQICPTAGCLQNAPYVVRGRLHFRPRPIELSRPGQHCPYCGEKLIAQCPHCQTPISPSAAFCADCGRPFVVTPEELAVHPDPHGYEENFARRLNALAQHLHFDRPGGASSR